MRRALLAAVLLLIVLFVVRLTVTENVWACLTPTVSVTTTNPTVNHPVTTSGVVCNHLDSVGVAIYSNSSCGPGTTGIIDSMSGTATALAMFTFTFPGSDFPTPGAYYVVATDISSTFSSTCNLFSVAPAALPSQYLPITIGGTMLPINRFQIILPWAVLIALLGGVSVWTLVVERRKEAR